MFNLKNAPKCLVEQSNEAGMTYGFHAAKDGTPAELLIYEQIGEDWYGEGVTAKAVRGLLNDIEGRDINVRINSPGGLVYDGLVIYNALKSHTGHVNVIIEGLAFSAASFIAMAGHTVQMYKASDLGIHRAWGGAVGNAKAMRATGEWLDTIDTHLVDIYEDKTGKSREDIEGWLDGTDDGTVFSATEAVEIGFADELVDTSKPEEKSTAVANAFRRVEKASMNNIIAALNARKSA